MDAGNPYGIVRTIARQPGSDAHGGPARDTSAKSVHPLIHGDRGWFAGREHLPVLPGTLIHVTVEHLPDGRDQHRAMRSCPRTASAPIDTISARGGRRPRTHSGQRDREVNHMAVFPQLRGSFKCQNVKL